jgi:hypothetical protein
LASLYEELRNIQVFDRIHDYSAEADPASDRAYEIRQMRRKQIVDEIARLRPAKPEPSSRTRIGSVLAIACALCYGMLYYLLR